MGHPKFIVSNQKEGPISIQRVTRTFGFVADLTQSLDAQADQSVYLCCSRICNKI